MVGRTTQREAHEQLAKVYGTVGLRSYPCYDSLMATTDKVSVSIGREELRNAKRLASRLGLNLSTFITDAVRRRIADQKRQDAAHAVLSTFAPEDRASPDEMRELLARWGVAGARRTAPRRARKDRSKRKGR